MFRAFKQMRMKWSIDAKQSSMSIRYLVATGLQLLATFLSPGNTSITSLSYT